MQYRIEEAPEGTGPKGLSLLARQVLGRLLSETYGIRDLPEIAVTASGKPYFPAHPGIHFSLSHCRRAVLAVVDDAPVGCDIEEADQDFTDEMLAVAFSEKESGIIMHDSDPAIRLTWLWTRKEAVVKRTGLIPDDPRDWPSEDPGLITRLLPAQSMILSIATLNP